MKTDNSHELFEQAKKYIPGGVNSPVRAFGAVGGSPLYIKKAKGAYVYDEDGNRFIDYVASWGPAILGHADNRVIQKVQEVCEGGLSFGAPTKRETEIAQIISDAIPCAENVRLVSSGTEAVMSAVRCARGYTDKDKIIKFKGNYHGHSDCLLVKAGSGLLTQNQPSSGGIPKNVVKDTLLAEYNSEKEVEALFEKYKNEIACVVVEPVAANMGVVPPKKGFLNFLRDITERNGSLLIFDEVITGFRIAYGGASEYFGIKPDMVTLGKIVGGGMPLAAYAGKREIMQCVAPVGNVYQAGTLSGNPVAVTAGIETLKILRENKGIYRYIDRQAAKLEKAYKEKGLTVNRVGSLLSPFFTHSSVENNTDAQNCNAEAFRAYFCHMLKNGVYVAPSQFESMFVGACHSDEIVEETVKAVERLEIRC